MIIIGYCFNIFESKLVYIDKFNEIQIIDIDSLEKERIAFINNSNYEANYLLVHNGFVYYRDNNGDNIYKTDFKGKEKTLIAEYTTGDVQIINNEIYYISANTNNLYKKDIMNEQEPIKVIEDAIMQFFVKDKNIIYIYNNNLNIYNIENNTKEILKENVTSNFTINENNIYVYISESKNILEINIENKMQMPIVENIEKDIFRLQMFNDNIYYSYSSGYPYVKYDLYSLNTNEKKIEKIDIR